MAFNATVMASPMAVPSCSWIPSTARSVAARSTLGGIRTEGLPDSETTETL